MKILLKNYNFEARTLKALHACTTLKGKSSTLCVSEMKLDIFCYLNNFDVVIYNFHF